MRTKRENKGLSIISKLKYLALAVIFTLSLPILAIANDTESSKINEIIKDSLSPNENHQALTDENHAVAHGEKTVAFNPGKMILDHVKDAHDWHILDYHGHAVGIPLPVILVDNGLHIFMSSRFEHGHAVVESKGNYYKLYDGHIYKTDATGKLKVGEKEAILNVQPMDFSITKNVAALFVGAILILILFFSVAKAYNSRGNTAPKGLQSFMEPLILFIKDEVAIPSIGVKHYAKFLPMLLTIFFFIFINNLLGLIPIVPFGANLTGNIAITMILALTVFIVVTFSGNKYYWKHIFMPDVPKALWILLIPIELFGILLKPFVLMLRLFANITAGHIIMLGFFSLIFIFGERNVASGYGTSILSVSFTLFMSVLELLVAFLQAYVFTLLTSLYIGSAVEEHPHSVEEHH